MNANLWQTQPLWVLLTWLPVPLGCALLALPASRAWGERLARPWVAWAFFLLTRVAFAVVVFGVFGHRSIDLVASHEPQGEAILAGKIPYRDFVSLYAPGFPYVLALAMSISHLWGALLVFVLADLGAFLALARLHGDAAPGPASPAWLYLAFPPVWYFEVRYAQDETLSSLFLALALLAAARGRGVRQGLALALGQLFTKPLFGAGAAPLLLTPRASWGARWAYVIPVGAIYLAMTVAGIPWSRDLRLEASAFGVGPTLWRLPEVWGHLELGRLAWAPEVVLVAVGFTRLWRRRADGVSFVAWMWGCHAALAPKLLPMYVVMVAPALAVWVGRAWREGRLAWWALYGLAMGSAWYADSGPLQGMLGPVGVAVGAVFMLAPVVLAAWLLLAVWREPAAR